MVLGTNSISTFAIYLYSDIQWGQRAQIGFNSGDGYSSLMLSKALTDETLDVDEQSNVEKPGVFIFRIDSKIECRDSYYAYVILYLTSDHRLKFGQMLWNGGVL